MELDQQFRIAQSVPVVEFFQYHKGTLMVVPHLFNFMFRFHDVSPVDVCEYELYGIFDAGRIIELFSYQDRFRIGIDRIIIQSHACIGLTYEAEANNITSDAIITEIINKVQVP